MIHKIKSLYDNGNGLTERKIVKASGLSRNTASKYLHMPEAGMSTVNLFSPHHEQPTAQEFSVILR